MESNCRNFHPNFVFEYILTCLTCLNSPFLKNIKNKYDLINLKKF